MNGPREADHRMAMPEEWALSAHPSNTEQAQDTSSMDSRGLTPRLSMVLTSPLSRELQAQLKDGSLLEH